MSPETELPDLIYLPCGEHVAAVADARPLLQRLPDGQVLLPTYSTADLLYAVWGANHPWLAFPSRALETLHESQNFDLVGLDLPAQDRAEDD